MSGWFQKIEAFVAPYNKIYFYSADPGATAALKPYHQAAQNLNKPARWFVDGWAAHEYIPDSETVIDTPHFLPPNLSKDDLVLMGQQVNFHKAYQRLEHAKQSGAHVVFVSDHWKDISGIFRPEPDNQPLLPDLMLLPDQKAFYVQGQTLKKAGFSDEDIFSCLKVFLHSGIEKSLEKIEQTPEPIQIHLKRKYELNQHTTLMLLDCIDNVQKQEIGFDWKDCLKAAAEYINQNDIQTTLLVKPHPRQDTNQIQSHIDSMETSHTRIICTEEQEAEPLISISDAVWGITTVLLVVALKAGKPIKAFMPGRTPLGQRETNAHIEPYIVL